MTGRDRTLVWLAACQSHETPPDDSWLKPRERETLAGLRLEKRRREWRMGRWCAKLAVRACTGLPLDEITISQADDGAPEAFGAADMPVISISHRGDRAVAIAAPLGTRAGCDLELIEPRSERFIQDYLTATESARVLSVSGHDRDLLANLCWCAKEAVVKAARTGLRVDTRSVDVALPVSLEQPNDWRQIAARSASAGTFTGCWRAHGTWVEAVLADRPIRIQFVS